MRNLKLSATIGLIALLIIFTLQNVERVQVSFLFWSFEMRRALLLFLIFLIGVTAGWVLHSVRRKGRE